MPRNSPPPAPSGLLEVPTYAQVLSHSPISFGTSSNADRRSPSYSQSMNGDEPAPLFERIDLERPAEPLQNPDTAPHFSSTTATTTTTLSSMAPPSSLSHSEASQDLRLMRQISRAPRSVIFDSNLPPQEQHTSVPPSALVVDDDLFDRDQRSSGVPPTDFSTSLLSEDEDENTEGLILYTSLVSGFQSRNRRRHAQRRDATYPRPTFASTNFRRSQPQSRHDDLLLLYCGNHDSSFNSQPLPPLFRYNNRRRRSPSSSATPRDDDSNRPSPSTSTSAPYGPFSLDQTHVDNDSKTTSVFYQPDEDMNGGSADDVNNTCANGARINNASISKNTDKTERGDLDGDGGGDHDDDDDYDEDVPEGGCGILVCARASATNVLYMPPKDVLMTPNLPTSQPQNQQQNNQPLSGSEEPFLFCSDLPPPSQNVSQRLDMEPRLNRHHYLPPTCCHCITIEFGCRSCGNSLGFQCLSPCTSCSSIFQDNSFFFRSDRVTAIKRIRGYEPFECISNISLLPNMFRISESELLNYNKEDPQNETAIDDEHISEDTDEDHVEARKRMIGVFERQKDDTQDSTRKGEAYKRWSAPTAMYDFKHNLIGHPYDWLRGFDKLDLRGSATTAPNSWFHRRLHFENVSHDFSPLDYVLGRHERRTGSAAATAGDVPDTLDDDPWSDYLPRVMRTRANVQDLRRNSNSSSTSSSTSTSINTTAPHHLRRSNAIRIPLQSLVRNMPRLSRPTSETNIASEREETVSVLNGNRRRRRSTSSVESQDDAVDDDSATEVENTAADRAIAASTSSPLDRLRSLSPNQHLALIHDNNSTVNLNAAASVNHHHGGSSASAAAAYRRVRRRFGIHDDFQHNSNNNSQYRNPPENECENDCNGIDVNEVINRLPWMNESHYSQNSQTSSGVVPIAGR